MSKETRRRLAMTSVAAWILAGMCGMSLAQADFPSRNIRIIAPHTPGSSSDTLARAIADQMSANLKTVSVTVENREGAAGVVAASYVKAAPPDGYTILIVVPALVFAPLMQPRPVYDFAKSFTPLVKVAENPYILFSSAASPFKTFPEAVAYAKKNPNKLSYVGAGRGGQPHLGTEVLKKLYGFEAQEVQYKKVSDAVVDMVAGRMDLFLVNVPPVRAQLANGTIRAIAVASDKRLKILPDVPTFAELGKPFEYSAWFAFVAPMGTPQIVVDRLAMEITKAAGSPAVRDKVENVLTGVVSIEGPQALSKLIKSDQEVYGKLITDLRLVEQ